ncbi:hypothetical protein [Alkalimonas mucilaginosa]|uniref:Uncharacterized protein n=1 Tax=Alkalimonas mucilaginosa TaxID=3057676 RepID=A0ABU7JDK9_9GAMM|nr:hypothetical protein [Alkalimonas sp. MEB004]MEE2023570.1 hypothetical protein [Alkalimonas sp. MEB004]
MAKSFAKVAGFCTGYQFLIVDMMREQRFVFAELAAIRRHDDFAAQNTALCFEKLRYWYQMAQRLAMHDNSVSKAHVIYRMNKARCQRFERKVMGVRLP